MNDSHNRHTEGLSFGSFFKKVFCEDMISFYYREGYYVENSPKGFVTPLGYFAPNFGLTGFIDGRVDAGIGDEFFV